MSFKNIRYDEIITEKWEDSRFYGKLTKRFLFMIFQEGDKGVTRFDRVMFWTMPYSDLKGARKVWKDTKDKVSEKDYSRFIKISDGYIAHVRPKAKNKSQKFKTIEGKSQKGLCFWLNADYIKSQTLIGN